MHFWLLFYRSARRYSKSAWQQQSSAIDLHKCICSMWKHDQSYVHSIQSIDTNTAGTIRLLETMNGHPYINTEAVFTRGIGNAIYKLESMITTEQSQWCHWKKPDNFNENVQYNNTFATSGLLLFVCATKVINIYV